MQNLTNENVLKALGRVEEPDLKKDLVSLGMIKNLEVTGNTIRFTVQLTTPACPLKELIKEAEENQDIIYGQNQIVAFMLKDLDEKRLEELLKRDTRT